MAIKDLLIAYQGDDSSRNALKFALQMGEKYDALVTGAYVHEDTQYYRKRHWTQWVPENVGEMLQRAEQDATAKIERSFREAVAKEDVDCPSDWTALRGQPSIVLARMARFFDILITGQFESAIRNSGHAVQPEELIRRSGRPMLIVPEKYEVRPFKEVAVVAWDGSSSAARALADAMQVLETKKKLYVVTVEEEDERTTPLIGHDIIEHLKRHSIEAERVRLESGIRAGKAILDYCEQVDPDVLVMGAFGRNRLGSLLFGGVSQYILENQTVPVLMSH